MKPIFKRFNDLMSEDINFDFQMHTNQTDGSCSAEEMIAAAVRLKLKAIAITEHVNKQSDWFDDFKQKMDGLKNNNQIKIYFGIEARVINSQGDINATSHMIDNSDLVLGVVHRYPTPDGKGLLSLEDIKNLGQKQALKIEFEFLMALLDNKNINVLGHPFGMYLKLFDYLPEEHIRRLLIKSLKNNIAVEINTKYMTCRKLFFKVCREINPYVSLGSDAHKKEDVAMSFDAIKKEIKK